MRKKFTSSFLFATTFFLHFVIVVFTEFFPHHQREIIKTSISPENESNLDFIEDDVCRQRISYFPNSCSASSADKALNRWMGWKLYHSATG